MKTKIIIELIQEKKFFTMPIRRTVENLLDSFYPDINYAIYEEDQED